MTETVAPASGDPASPAGDTGTTTEDTTPQSAPRTVEEVEAEWKHRFSQRDRAHNEETAALRTRLATLEQADKTRAEQEQQARLSSVNEAERAAAERDEYKRLLDEERAARIMDYRKARFPLSSDAVDEATLASMDEAKLAALEVRLGGNGTAPSQPAPDPTSLIDPNSAARTAPTTPRDPSEKTSDELKADLARMGPEFARELESAR